MAITQSRTLIKTATPGWFINPLFPDKKVRKNDGDTILTQAEYDAQQAPKDEGPGAKALENMLNAPISAAREAQREKLQLAKLGTGNPVPESDPVSAEGDATADNEVGVVLSTGRTMKSKAVEIRCAWVDEDKRTPEQQAIFEGPKKDITYEDVKAAAGGKRSAFPDGTKRVIAVQDAFQVRFTPANQEKYRREQRRRNYAAKRAAKG